MMGKSKVDKKVKKLIKNSIKDVINWNVYDKPPFLTEKVPLAIIYKIGDSISIEYTEENNHILRNAINYFLEVNCKIEKETYKDRFEEY